MEGQRGREEEERDEKVDRQMAVIPKQILCHPHHRSVGGKGGEGRGEGRSCNNGQDKEREKARQVKDRTSLSFPVVSVLAVAKQLD